MHLTNLVGVPSPPIDDKEIYQTVPKEDPSLSCGIEETDNGGEMVSGAIGQDKEIVVSINNLLYSCYRKTKPLLY